ncbi:MAG: hypothetical protein J5789_06010 [Oscillospiraceae bacterium]|nr:hypothetical protein [Oscillospiraceae bacterium]
MHQTERKTDQARQSEQKARQTKQSQSLEEAAECAQVLAAILAGGSWEQFPAERLRTLSGMVGNAALVELMTQRETGPALAMRLPVMTECTAAPVGIFGVGDPSTVQAPDFDGMSPIESAQPLAL